MWLTVLIHRETPVPSLPLVLPALESSSCPQRSTIELSYLTSKVNVFADPSLNSTLVSTGEVLGIIETHQGHLNYAAVSPCGRFFGSSGFTSDVRFFEVCFEKANGNFKEIRKVFDLKGHNAQVLSFSLNKDSTRAATISKDNTWKLWNTDVDYIHKQDPRCYHTGSLSHSIERRGWIVLAPDALSTVIATDARLMFFNLSSERKTCEEDIEHVHSGKRTRQRSVGGSNELLEPIQTLAMDSTGKYVASAGDRQIRVFYNVAGELCALSS